MAIRLEPFYLANILLFIPDCETIKTFSFVSKNCHKAMLTLKVNPGKFNRSRTTILKFFPNINTMVLDSSERLGDIDTFPDTITSVVLERVDFKNYESKNSDFSTALLRLGVPTPIRVTTWTSATSPASRNCQLSVKTIASSYQNAHSKASGVFRIGVL